MPLKHRSLLAVAVVGLLLIIWGSRAEAHVGSVVFPVFELPTSALPVLDDGTLEDWRSALPGTSIDHNSFSPYPRGAVDPGDLAWGVYLAWHHSSQKIYAAIERVDDELMPSSPDGVFTFAIDGDHSGGQYILYDSDAFTDRDISELTNTQAQLYSVSFTVQDGFGFISTTGLGTSWVLGDQWTNAFGSYAGESPSYSVVEFSVTPWDRLNHRGPDVSMRSSLTSGRLIGIQMIILDIDGAEPKAYWIALPTVGPRGQEIAFAENFVDAELLPCNLEDCSGAAANSSVDSGSWARIKLGL